MDKSAEESSRASTESLTVRAITENPGLHVRWTRDRIDHVLECLTDSSKGVQAILAQPWYVDENGFDRTQHWAEGERIDLRGLFLQNVDLRNVDLRAARLDECSFFDVDLTDAQLRFAVFRDCQFGRVRMVRADLCLVDFTKSQFVDADVSHADCTGARFIEFNFAGTKALGTNFGSASFEDSRVQTLDWDGATSFLGVDLGGTRFTQDPMLRRHIEDQNWLAAREREIKQSRFGKLAWFLWGLTSSHGRSFVRWSTVSLLIAIVYGVIYQFVALKVSSDNIHPVVAKFYFSIVTFTTLGFGDVVPDSNISALVVMTEVLLGYLMLGALLSILTDRFARRS